MWLALILHVGKRGHRARQPAKLFLNPAPVARCRSEGFGGTGADARARAIALKRGPVPSYVEMTEQMAKYSEKTDEEYREVERLTEIQKLPTCRSLLTADHRP
jgi:hypothetical protein